MKETTADISAGKQVTNCSCEMQKVLNLSILAWYDLLVRSDNALVNKLSATLVKAEGPAG